MPRDTGITGVVAIRVKIVPRITENTVKTKKYQEKLDFSVLRRFGSRPGSRSVIASGAKFKVNHVVRIDVYQVNPSLSCLALG